MQNQIITNTQLSVLDMSPLHDAHGNALVLKPKGQKGDSKEISGEVAASEIVDRVKKAKWVTLSAVTTAPSAPPSAPPIVPPPAAPLVVEPPHVEVPPHVEAPHEESPHVEEHVEPDHPQK